MRTLSKPAAMSHSHNQTHCLLSSLTKQVAMSVDVDTKLSRPKR